MLQELLNRIKIYNPKADLKLIERAFNLSKKAHEGQKRHSGEEYFTHPYQVAIILTELKADSASICAGLLHDVLEDCKVKLKDLEKEIGQEIAGLVEGLTKISDLNFNSKEEYNAENIRKVLLATTKDVRVILIKLADRLHNMRTLKHLPEERRIKFAQESATIYAPIAQKLGLYSIKGELEDLALRYLEPDSYKFLTEKVNEKRKEREKRTEEFITTVKSILKRERISAKVNGRAKYFSSIYKTMKKRNKEFSEIYDLIAIRIITNTMDECYRALGKVHEHWKPIPKKFKDYIAVPKANGYQSLHTSIITHEGRIIEVQIRTKEMDLIAEEGIAAHWRYKGTERDKKFEQKINWIKQFLHWKSNAREFVDTLKFDFFEKEIIVFTPKGDPIVLPEGSTPIDFAYTVHSSIGNQCSKVDVNGKIAPFDYILKSGDIIHIMTINNGLPNRQWLKFVKTSKARNKIRQKLGIDGEFEKSRETVEESILNKIETSLKNPIKLSGCCSPHFKEDIVAFLTKEEKITIHAKTCINAKLPLKQVPVSWKKINESIELRVYVSDRVGMLSDVLSVISDVKLNILRVSTSTTKNRAVIAFWFDKKDEIKIHQIAGNLRLIKDIAEVKVLS